MPDTLTEPLGTGRLPLEFGFGVATAAIAVDGDPTTEDRAQSLSIWDVFAAAPGRISDGSTPSDAPDHRAHRRADVQLLAELGVSHYRFSLPWGRCGHRPDVALDDADRLLDELAERGIAAVVTLTHYDMPLAVMERGGWLVRDTAEEFGSWAQAAAARLADRTSAWVTMNAPFVHTAYGYGLGIEAPGLTLLGGALHAGLHQLVGHGLAVQALRAAGAHQVGIANAHTWVTPISTDPADVAAAELYDALHNRAFTDPLLGQPWPTALLALPGAPEDYLSDRDSAIVSTPLDFYGVNYYYPQLVAAGDNATIPFALVDPDASAPTDEFGWPIDPAALTSILTSLASRYPTLPPIWVTENGTQDSGGTDDGHRADYLAAHLDAIADARFAGADVRAYFHWSLLDGWEFAEGLSRKFGLVAVDAATRQRHPKHSFARYRELIAAHR